MPKYRYVVGAMFEVEADTQEEADEIADKKDTSKLKAELVSCGRIENGN